MGVATAQVVTGRLALQRKRLAEKKWDTESTEDSRWR